MKIAIVKCPWWVRYCPPYILAFFAALLRKKGHEVRCFDLNNSLYHGAQSGSGKYWDDRDAYSLWENPGFVRMILSEGASGNIADEILNTDPSLICFTTHTTNTLISLELARKIKQSDSSKIIVFLGHKCSRAQMAHDFIKEPQVDYVCTGEADIALCELIDKLESRKNSTDLPECRGFLVKRDGNVIDCGDPPVAEDLDSLPFPDYDDFSQDIRGMRYSQPERLDILDSRGCVNSCHFCYEGLYWQKYRTMSGRRIYEQIRAHIKKYPQINYFYFNGLLLNGKLKTLEDFCDNVIQDGLKIKWAGQAMIRADMPEELFIKMKKAGCSWLHFGAESGSDRVLKSMNKRHKTAEAVKVLKDTHEAGIKAQVNMMFGFPTENEDDFKETLGFVEKIRPYIDSVLASQSFCTLEKETFMRRYPEKFGITQSENHLFWKSMNGANTYAKRFRRYEEFCRFALSLGLPETSGVLSKKPDKWALLGDYHYYEKDYNKAAECYEKSVEQEEKNKIIYKKLARSYEKSSRSGRALDNYRAALNFSNKNFDIPEIDKIIKEKIELLEQEK